MLLLTRQTISSILTPSLCHPFFSFLQSTQMFRSFDAGLTIILSKMGVEHFVASPTKPDAYTKDEKTENTEIHKDRGIEQ